MVLQSSKKVEENLAGDLERFDQVPLLEDGVGDAGQRLLVRQLRDSEHVDTPLFRILQDLRTGLIMREFLVRSFLPWPVQLHASVCLVRPRIEAKLTR